MRARVIAAVLALATTAACDSGADAPGVDAAPPDPPATLPTAWLIDVLETPRLEQAVIVPGGFVLVGNAEVFRFTDDGVLEVRRDLPERWGNVFAIGTPAGNVLLSVQAVEPAEELVEELVVELDGITLEVKWTYVVSATEWPYTSAIGLVDGRTIAVTRAPLEPSIHGVHRIAADGTGSGGSLDAPDGAGSLWFERSDGRLAGVHAGGQCQHWTLDPDTLDSTFEPIDDPLCQNATSFETSGVQVITYPRYLDPTLHAVTIIGRDGAVLASSRTMPKLVAYRGALVTETLIAGLNTSGDVYVAHLDDLDAVVEMVVPFRPGGSSEGAVMASDGDRTFIAWLDQVSTFDTVLRVARVGDIE